MGEKREPPRTPQFDKPWQNEDPKAVDFPCKVSTFLTTDLEPLQPLLFAGGRAPMELTTEVGLFEFKTRRSLVG